MNHLIQEANSFSKIIWACAVTLNPFVGFGECVLVDNYRPVYLKKKKAIDLSIGFIWKCTWWDKAGNGVSGEEVQFFLFNGIKLVKMHSDGKLIHLAINIY